ncbi:UTP--glucose-1-phosphate uridylyltransferase [Enemella evansiae]|uniref:UTP--glucose-1-phosphate uridylyltransferase n=1 Tax=Enemella evansiae TaxID=2016499 RepID=A0A255GFA8_9ACTN|nr:UTP--glucose-1-phosphate uridylyltransferase [Enemella evansiae]OYO07768.1 UTP--glucose-1-phosphate uridylyltransferase [Enemella evansiae]OYO11654.1 UTP--glucose-1-phosphate uridylyltransferase [Enemella evansiae]
MSAEGLRSAIDKMTEAGVDPVEIEVFRHYYSELESGATGLIAEDSISPLTEVDRLADQHPDPEQSREALAQTVMIKLNGGLGTSMGMDRAKSLLPVRDGKTFLDLILQQVRSARETHGARLPLLLMDSFRTRADTLAVLADQADLPVGDLPPDFLQNFEPKLRTDDLTPVSWPADESLEWCPPGHGDIYPALLGSGILDRLLEQGFRYASVSNSDNLGAAPDPVLAGWFAASGAPYAAELCRRTVNDRKGGHLAVRRSDGRLILRDTAQTADDEMHFFTDEHRHPFFHTNNLWWDLQRLREVLVERRGVLGLPLIRNTKTVDPADSDSPEVFQVETAMGAAIEVFEGATAIVVDRSRFLPVKTTNELLLLRSDCYRVRTDGTLEATTDSTPAVSLDSAYYKKIGDFDARFADGAPSLREATSLQVQGDFSFGADVVVRGKVELDGGAEQQRIEPGTVLGG